MKPRAENMPSSILDEHFQNPRNAGVLEGADVAVKVENPVCGDVLHLYLKVGPGSAIDACKFQVYGCPAAIAAGSLLTEAVRGRTMRDLERMTQEDISKALGGLAADKLHAAALARDAVHAAAKAWAAKPGSEKPGSEKR